jgi:hypothetical protein
VRAIKESLGSESNQRSLGGSIWPSNQEVLAGSIGQASMKSWLEALFGCEWQSELQNSAVQIPGVMGYCGKYAQKWTHTLIMFSTPQEWICRRRKCL